MTDVIDSAVARALKEGELTAAETLIRSKYGNSICLRYSEKRDQPFAVVGLQSDAKNNLTIGLMDGLSAHIRADFAITRLVLSLPLIEAFLKSMRGTEGSTYLSLDDHKIWPGLSFCDFGEDAFLVPDPVFLLTRGYHALRTQFASQPVGWQGRRPVAFWRGSTTGRLHDVESWRHLPRVRLCEIAAAEPDIFDVGISQIVGLHDEAQDLEKMGYMREYVPDTNFQNYRIQIDIDGNSNSWPGLFSKLLTGCPVLKVASPLRFRQWYYDLLKPWVNYIPISSSMEELPRRVRWLLANPEICWRIGQAGQRLAMQLTYQKEIDRSVDTISAAVMQQSALAFSD